MGFFLIEFVLYVLLTVTLCLTYYSACGARRALPGGEDPSTVSPSGSRNRQAVNAGVRVALCSETFQNCEIFSAFRGNWAALVCLSISTKVRLLNIILRRVVVGHIHDFPLTALHTESASRPGASSAAQWAHRAFTHARPVSAPVESGTGLHGWSSLTTAARDQKPGACVPVCFGCPASRFARGD